jgi:hypothetical protein
LAYLYTILIDTNAGKGTRHFNPLEDNIFFHHWFNGVKRTFICRNGSESLKIEKKSGKILEFNVENCVGTLLM